VARKRKPDDLSGWGGDDGRDDPTKAWKLTREKALLGAGLMVIFASFINSEVLDGTFHREYLIAALALCGISITTWLDRRK
jgi:hypothetical protein